MAAQHIKNLPDSPKLTTTVRVTKKTRSELRALADKAGMRVFDYTERLVTWALKEARKQKAGFLQ